MDVGREDDILVRLVGDDVEIMVPGQVEDLAEGVAGDDRSGWIVRRVDEDGLRA